MNENGRKICVAIGSIIGSIIGRILSCFVWAIPFYFAYNWITKNFTLPSISYLKMVAVYASASIILNIIIQPFRKKK